MRTGSIYSVNPCLAAELGQLSVQTEKILGGGAGGGWEGIPDVEHKKGSMDITCQ